MKIFIPTRGRVNKQICLKHMPQLKDHAIMVVPECEKQHWKDPVVVPDEYQFSDIRQYIMENFNGKHIVIDDDVRFYRRITPGDWHLRDANWDDLQNLFKWIENLFYAHGGVSAREFDNHGFWDRHPWKTYKLIGRCMRFHFYRSEICRQFINFTDIPAKQDFHFTLTMLENGYPNIINYEFAQGQQGGSNMEGGCSRYRDRNMLTKSALMLKELHPNFVTVVNKETKDAWGGGTRKDVRIRWRKAFEDSKT